MNKKDVTRLTSNELKVLYDEAITYIQNNDKFDSLTNFKRFVLDNISEGDKELFVKQPKSRGVMHKIKACWIIFAECARRYRYN